MRVIFLWFYRLPIAEAVMLILTCTALFLLLRKYMESCRCWKAAMGVLLCCWGILILYATLVQRTEGSGSSVPIWTPFHSYYAVLHGGSRELYRSNFMNAVLFYPAGLLGYELLPKRWGNIGKLAAVTIFFALASFGIEYAQYRFRLGLAETDDIIHNGLGALLGALPCCLRTKKNT